MILIKTEEWIYSITGEGATRKYFLAYVESPNKKLQYYELSREKNGKRDVIIRVERPDGASHSSCVDLCLSSLAKQELTYEKPSKAELGFTAGLLVGRARQVSDNSQVP